MLTRPHGLVTMDGEWSLMRLGLSILMMGVTTHYIIMHYNVTTQYITMQEFNVWYFCPHFSQISVTEHLALYCAEMQWSSTAMNKYWNAIYHANCYTALHRNLKCNAHWTPALHDAHRIASVLHKSTNIELWQHCIVFVRCWGEEN